MAITVCSCIVCWKKFGTQKTVNVAPQGGSGPSAMPSAPGVPVMVTAGAVPMAGAPPAMAQPVMASPFTAQPVAAKPVTAQPVAAKPVTAQQTMEVTIPQGTAPGST